MRKDCISKASSSKRVIVLIFHSCFSFLIFLFRQLGLADLFPSESVPNQLLQQLEILSSNSRSLAYRPAEVALSLIAADFQSMAEVHPGHSATLMGFINELQKFCNIQVI